MIEESIIKQLQSLMPDWKFAKYGDTGDIACYPPDGVNAQSYRALSRRSMVVTGVCGPLYTARPKELV